MNKKYTFKDGVLEFNPNVVIIFKSDIDALIRNDIEKVIIREGVRLIEPEAFINCKNMRSVTLPQSLQEICRGAFAECTNLTSIDLPSNLTVIKEYAFRNCPLENINFPNHLEFVHATAIDGTKYYENEENWIDGVLYVDDYLLAIDFDTKDCSVRDGTKLIASNAFAGSDKLTTVNIPNSVKYINESAFSSCDSLLEVTLPEGLTEISRDTFGHCSSLNKINIPHSVVRIGEYAFSECPNIKEVHIDSISDWCEIDFDEETSVPFYADTKLYIEGEAVENLIIPEDVIGISPHAFGYISTIKSITIPYTLKEIGASAFFSNEGIKSVCISDLSAWCKINFEDDTANPLVYSSNLYLNGELVTDLKIPKDITTVLPYAFEGCVSIRNLYIGENVKEIGESSFEDCKNLKCIKIKNGLEKIPERAFAFSTSLDAIYLPATIKYIDEDAFIHIKNKFLIHGKNEYTKSWALENEYEYAMSQINTFLDSIEDKNITK